MSRKQKKRRQKSKRDNDKRTRSTEDGPQRSDASGRPAAKADRPQKARGDSPQEAGRRSRLNLWVLVIVVLAAGSVTVYYIQLDPQVAQESSEQQDASLTKKEGPASWEDIDESAKQYVEVLKSDPHNSEAHNNLGVSLLGQGKTEKAIEHFRQALQITPNYAQAHNNLGVALRRKGEIEEALEHTRQALRFKPGYADAHNNLGTLLIGQEKTEEAFEHFRQALQLKPDFPMARKNLRAVLQRRQSQGVGLQRPENTVEAIELYQFVLQIDPNHMDALNNLAWIRATHADSALRDGDMAVELAERCCQMTRYRAPAALDTLAAALAEAGRFDEAVRYASTASSLATTEGDEKMAQEIGERLQLYRQRKAYRDPSR